MYVLYVSVVVVKGEKKNNDEIIISVIVYKFNYIYVQGDSE